MKARAKKWIESFPDMIEDAYELGEGVSYKGISKVLVCGMGGSAIAGDLLASVVDFPVMVNRGYDIPDIDSKTLVIISSYSGNTEETIAAWKKAKRKTKRILILTSGGKLGKEKNKIVIPEGLLPRYALPYSFFPMLRVVQNSVGGSTDTKEIISNLRRLDKGIARRIAEKINGKIPLIYSTREYSSGTYRWQCQLNENSKHFCHSHVFSEINHNEIEVFGSRKDFFTVLIRGDEHPRVKKHIEAAKHIIGDYIEVRLRGGSFISKLFYLVYLGDWVSYYLAEKRGADPEEIKNIRFIKGELKKG